MKQAHIYLHGAIGSFIDPTTKEEIKGIELIDVIAQVQSNPGAEEYLFHCKGPGGLVSVGDQIYDYMIGLKATAKVNTIQDGDIGSIMTKPFLAGDERTVTEPFEFFIHNPWNQPEAGDSNHQAMELESLIKSESKLRNFYIAKTGVTAEGLKGLMDNQTAMTAEQALVLKFATKKVSASKVKTLAFTKSNIDMSKTLTPGQKFATKMGEALDLLLGSKPAIVALDLPTKAGGNISVSAEDPNNLVGADATITDAAGASAPAPDGEHELSDGRIVVVAGGKVTEVKQAAAAAQPAAATPAPDAALQAKVTALETELSNLKAAQANTVAVDEKINAAVTELKNSLTAGKTPVKNYNSNGQGKQAKELSPIQIAMRKESK